MLSRVAERLYWLARYAERAENAARLINVYSNLLFDLPRGKHVGWTSLIAITGTEEFFNKPLENATERDVMHFLLADKNNPSSIYSTVIMARENARITREIMPAETWELINNLYLYVHENLAKGVARKGRNEFLNQIIASVQQFTGFLIGSMSHNTAYEFIKFGRNLERADMTSRIVDIGTENLIINNAQDKPVVDEILPLSNILWVNVLRSLSAYQMYRQHERDKVVGDRVVSFLLKNSQFPRSINNCLERLQACLHNLPHSKEAISVVSKVQKKILQAEPEKLTDQQLHDFLEVVQGDIASIHFAVADAWFDHR